MTTYSTNTRTDPNARRHRLAETRKQAEAHVRHLISGVSALSSRRPADPVEALAKAERRAAARRAADNLLLR